MSAAQPSTTRLGTPGPVADAPRVLDPRSSGDSPRLVEWVAELLLVGWQRQEAEGRYRGADDFRALHIDPRDGLASYRATRLPPAPWPAQVTADAEPVLASLAPGLGLTRAESFVGALAASVELEPRLRPLVAALSDDPALRLPTVGLACELGDSVGLPASAIRTCVADGRLGFLGLVSRTPVAGRPSRLDDALVADEWLVVAASGAEPVSPLRLVEPLGSAAVVARVGWETPWTLSGADRISHAERFAARLGRPVGLPNDAAEPVGVLVRAALVAGSGLLLQLAEPPDPSLVADAERAASLGCPIALSLAPGVSWIAPPSWHHERVRPPTTLERRARWTSRLAQAGVSVDAGDVAQIAGEFALGLDAVDDAVIRASDRLMGAEADVTAGAITAVSSLSALRDAARRTSWRDLSSCARPGPTGSGWDDLVVAPGVRRQLRDIVAAIVQRGRVLDDWGFGDRPGSRGYHVLFAGPSGTGKTMAAGVIAAETGQELWVVDLARVVDKYLGETEKAIDKVLRAAAASGAMLLFDEADALFGRRGEVKEARDRWANVEVAFLLQRIEEHDGVTVLTTNVSHHLDEAFARRMSQRVEFAVPDAALRRELWRRSMPAAAPLADPADLGVVADRFELAGGAIRTAALNAAYEAAAEGDRIGLPHLVQATVRELTKAGRAPTRADLAELALLAGGAP